MTSRVSAFSIAIFALSFIFSTFHAVATTFVNRPLVDVVNESPYIVRGVPAESYSEWGKGATKRVYTYTPFTVTEVVKGDLKETKITLRQPGGSKDGIEMRVPGIAQFAPGEDVVVLLSPKDPEDESYNVPGFTTGRYAVQKNVSGEEFLENSLGGGAMYDPKKDPSTASYTAKIPFEVFKKLARNQASPQEEQKMQYQPSQKQVADHEGHESHAELDDEKQSVVIGQEEDSDGEESGKESSLLQMNESPRYWIPISFFFFLLIGAYAIWRFIRK